MLVQAKVVNDKNVRLEEYTILALDIEDALRLVSEIARREHKWEKPRIKTLEVLALDVYSTDGGKDTLRELER